MFSTCCAAWLRPPWPFQPLALLPTHSLVFWFGDLNFRIESLDIRFVKYAIDSNILSQLWEKDQVRALGDTVEPLLGPEWHLALAKTACAAVGQGTSPRCPWGTKGPGAVGKGRHSTRMVFVGAGHTLPLLVC